MDKNLIASIPDLRTEKLVSLASELQERYDALRGEQVELTVETVTELTEMSASIKRIREELASREAAAAEAAKPAEPTQEELAAAVAAADEAIAEPEAAEEEDEAPAAEAPAEKTEAEAESTEEKELEPVAAAAEVSPVGVPSQGLEAASQPVASITAGADIPGVAAGSSIPDFKGVAAAFMQRREALRGASSSGDGDNVVVASIKAAYPEERFLSTDVSTNMDRLRDVTSTEAITASGGLCAPLEPYYGLQVIAQASRPVRDSLPKFAASRGGVTFITPPKLSDVASGIASTTAAADVGPYPSPTPYKPCVHVTCGTPVDVTVTAVHRCLTFGNFSARTFPEQVEAWLSLALASHARRAETLLLDAIDAACTATTSASTYSAVRTLLPAIDQAVVAYQNRNRMSQNATLRILLPDWARELIRSDVARSWRGDDPSEVLGVSDAQIEEWFTVRGVVPSWYIDSATSSGQLFGAQSAGALTAFPSTVVWYLYVEGSFVFLDGGTLDLGLVRDSTLNQTNDYQIFAETFEAVAFYGVEAIKNTTTVCPSGQYAPVASAAKPCSV